MSTTSTITCACEDFNEIETRSIPSTITQASYLNDDDAPVEYQVEHLVADRQLPSSIASETNIEDNEELENRVQIR